MSQFKKPHHFDRNLIVIGAGAAGLVASSVAATAKAKVTLIESGKMGGDCLNTGCVPSKSLIRSARMVSYIERSPEFGLRSMRANFVFSEVMERIQKSIATIELHDSIERYESLGVEVIQGGARLVSPWEVLVNGKTLSARHIVIATGAHPFVPTIPGLREVGCLTSDNVWQLRNKPSRMLVIGGGPVGCELSQSFARLGVDVTLVEMMPQLLPEEDEEVSAWIEQSFHQDGVHLYLGCKVVGVEQVARDKVVMCEKEGKRFNLPCDQILVAVGREANTQGLDLASIGVELADNGTIKVDKKMRSVSHPSIFACGDVAGPYQLTHAAAYQAWYAAINSLFGVFKTFKVDYRVMPYATFSDPEVARVGLNEQQAKQQDIRYEICGYRFNQLDRAIADEETQGFVKVLTKPGKDKILGVTIVGHHAADLIAKFVLAMKHGLGLKKLLGTLHIYPTLMEINQKTALEWRRSHLPERGLRWLEKYHHWCRGKQSTEHQQNLIKEKKA